MNTKKSTKRFTQKKVASYDYKWIMIIAIAIIAIVIAIVAIIAIVSHNNSYVSYVDGKGIRDYEYKMFLNTVVSDMEEAAQAENESFESAAFWTDAKKKEAEDKALEDARVWQAKYILALENGCKLTKAEEEEVENNINATINYYYQMYTQYGIDASNILSMLGIEDIDQTYAFQKKQMVVSKYAEKLMDAMKVEDLYFTGEDDKKVTGEDAILAKYNADKATYRKVELSSFVISKATPEVGKPSEVKDPGAAPEGKAETDEEYLEWESEKKAYDEYLKALEEYEKSLQEAVTKNVSIREKANAIFDALKADGKYTGEGIAEYPESEDSETTAPKKYTDATLGDLAKSEGVMFAETNGVNNFSGDPATTTDLLTKYATSLDWTDDTRTAVTYTEVKAEEPEEEEKTSDGTETEEPEELEYPNDYTTTALNELKIFEDESYIYITMCTNIYDINTSTSMEESEDGENSVRFNVVADLKSAKAEDDLNAEVAENASRFENKKVRNKVIEKVAETVFIS